MTNSINTIRLSSQIRLNYIEKLILWLFTFSCILVEISANSLYYVLPNMEIYASLVSVTTLLLFGGKLIERANRGIVLAFVIACFFFFLYVTLSQSDVPFITKIYYVLFAAGFLSLKFCYRQKVYDWFVKILAVLFFLGIIEFSLTLIGINFFWGMYERGGVLFNQGVFMSVPSYVGLQSVRFMAFCDEPGNVGTLSFFVLATMNRLKYTKEYIVFLVSGLLSFSLAFYSLYAILLFFRISNPIKLLKFIVPSMMILFVLYIPFGQYFEDEIISRVESKNSIGELDNRNSETANKVFEEFINSPQVLLGVGERTYYNWKKQSGNYSVGLKEHLLMYGIVGVSFLFLCFSIMLLKYNGYNKKTYILLLFYWISFYQRSYWFFPPLVVLLFNQSNKMDSPR